MAKKSSINQAKYDKEHIARYFLKLHKDNDKATFPANIIQPCCVHQKMHKPFPQKKMQHP